MPTDYVAYVIGLAATVADENLRGLLADVAYAARAESLFTWERWAAIWRLNTGHYSDLDLRAYQCRDPFLMVSEHVEFRMSLDDLNRMPRADGDRWQGFFRGSWTNPYILPRIFNAVHVTVDNPRPATELQLSLSYMEDYEIHVNGERVATIARVGAEGLLKNHTVRLPRPMMVDAISIRALGRHRQRAFSIGHLFVR